jgi:putative intracellular protease/amidase
MRKPTRPSASRKTKQRRQLWRTSKLSDSATHRYYDGVFYPGGHGPLWDLSENRYSIALIEAMHATGKLIAAVCHGPAAFRHTLAADGSPLVQGRSVTGFSNSEEAAVGCKDVVPFLVEDMLKRNGGRYSKAADWQPYVITDHKLITGQNPASAEVAAAVLLAKLSALDSHDDTLRQAGNVVVAG